MFVVFYYLYRCVWNAESLLMRNQLLLRNQSGADVHRF